MNNCTIAPPDLKLKTCIRTMLEQALDQAGLEIYYIDEAAPWGQQERWIVQFRSTLPFGEIAWRAHHAFCRDVTIREMKHLFGSVYMLKLRITGHHDEAAS